MKITSQQLRRIIKEEVTKSLKESPAKEASFADDFLSELAFVLDLQGAPVQEILAKMDAEAVLATMANLGHI